MLWNSGIEANKEIARKQKRRLQYFSNRPAFTSLVAGESSQFNLLLPSSPTLSGAAISVQGSAATAANALTIATSNGLSGVVGL